MSQSCACSLFLAKTNEKDACFRVPQSSSLPKSCAKEKSSGVEIGGLSSFGVSSDRATTLLSDLKGTREGVAVLLSSRLTPLSVPENSQRTRIDFSNDLVY